MKLMVEIGHPAHVHHFKNMIWKLETHGYDVKIMAKDKEVTLELLGAYGFEHEVLGRNYNGLLNKAYGLIEADCRLFKIANKFKPDLFVSRASPHSAHVSRLINRPHIAFCDTEHSTLSDLLAFPFTDVICTPSCYQKKISHKKHVMFNGYKELAYLHPDYFTPDPSVLDELGLQAGECFIILRFVAWGASHDVGHKGVSRGMRRRFVSELKKYGRVLITSESELPAEFEPYRITVAPEKMHDLLYYATLYVGEGGTMASEAAVLGTPSVYISSLVGTMGNFEELEATYGLIQSFRESADALEATHNILSDEDSKSVWQKRREILLSEKIDVTKFMTEFIEGYPESFKIMKENPDRRGTFK